MPDGGNPRAEELSWLLGSRGVGGTVFIMSQGEGRHSEEVMKSPTWEPSVLAIHMELWATAYFGVAMGELRSRLVCVAARLRDSVGEQKGWTWVQTLMAIEGESILLEAEEWVG